MLVLCKVPLDENNQTPVVHYNILTGGQLAMKRVSIIHRSWSPIREHKRTYLHLLIGAT